MTKRPLPDSRRLEEQRSQRLTQRVALAFLVVLVLIALALFLLT